MKFSKKKNPHRCAARRRAVVSFVDGLSMAFQSCQGSLLELRVAVLSRRRFGGLKN